MGLCLIPVLESDLELGTLFISQYRSDGCVHHDVGLLPTVRITCLIARFGQYLERDSDAHYEMHLGSQVQISIR